MNYSLSDSDIRKFIGEPVRIIKYSELSKFKTVDQLLHPYDGCFILYETDHNYGHWTVLFRNRWGIEFFDSYGAPIDTMIGNLKKSYPAGGAQQKPYLTALILRSLKANGERLHIISNKVALQSSNENITTCGRWAVFRYINRRSDLRSFIDLFKNQPDKDLAVTNMVLLE